VAVKLDCASWTHCLRDLDASKSLFDAAKNGDDKADAWDRMYGDLKSKAAGFCNDDTQPIDGPPAKGPAAGAAAAVAALFKPLSTLPLKATAAHVCEVLQTGTDAALPGVAIPPTCQNLQVC
jgi:hypothetical protein